MMYSANYPDILLNNIEYNPELVSANTDYKIRFAFTTNDKYDYEDYEALLNSAIREFRHSRFYTQYKSYLYSLGIDRCAFHPNITSDIADLEMHHCILNIYDIAILITEHILNTTGYLTEFDLAEYLQQEHVLNNIPIVFLCKTCHQSYHHRYLYVNPNQIFGQWWILMDKYKQGWNRDLLEKLSRYLQRGLDDKTYTRNEYLMKLRDDILNWADNRGVMINELNIKNTEDER